MHILLIARHYPPEISGGARRPSLYTQALRELGHRVTLVTPFKLDDPDSLMVENGAINRGRSALLMPQKKESRNFISHIIISYIKDRLRIWAYWPDENIIWARDVIKAVEHQNLKPDWIMTTSPPESIHIAGAKLSKYMKVPWIAEMRDTWVELPHRRILEESQFRLKIERHIAKKTLSSASAITAVSDIVMNEARKYTKKTTPECIISHFSDPPPAAYNFDASKINLVHTGGFTLSDRRRILNPLLEILDKAHARRPDLVFHIAGPLSKEESILIKGAKITVKWHGLVSLQKARALQAGADGLILYTPKNSHALPGKYAEYTLAQKPILYLGGGQWLKLVETPSHMRPLESAVFTIEKNEKIKTSKTLDNLQAAQKLITFLEAVDLEITQ